jgi:hypothetical protein
MRKNCNVCGSNELEQVIDLGLHPLADTFWSLDRIPEDYSLVPLIVNRCLQCNHLMTNLKLVQRRDIRVNLIVIPQAIPPLQ